MISFPFPPLEVEWKVSSAFRVFPFGFHACMQVALSEDAQKAKQRDKRWGQAGVNPRGFYAKDQPKRYQAMIMNEAFHEHVGYVYVWRFRGPGNEYEDEMRLLWEGESGISDPHAYAHENYLRAWVLAWYHRSTVCTVPLHENFAQPWKERMMIVRLITRLWVMAVNRSMYLSFGYHVMEYSKTTSFISWLLSSMRRYGLEMRDTCKTPIEIRHRKVEPLCSNSKPASHIKLITYEVRCVVGGENSPLAGWLQQQRRNLPSQRVGKKKIPTE